jgi:hypothetical protein
MKLSKIKLSPSIRLKPRKTSTENAGAKSASPARQTTSTDIVATQKIHGLPTSRWGINNPRPSPSSQPASAAKSTETAKASADARLTHFEFFAADARTVFLAGSFNQWNPSATPMTRLGDGKWVTELCLPAGRYEYLFVVDENYWTPDPKVRDYASNPFGGHNSVLEVSTSP